MKLLYSQSISIRIICMITVLLIILSSCEKMISVDLPKTKVLSKSIYQDDMSATAALRGIYSEMNGSLSSAYSGSSSGITLLTGLSADELVNYSNNTLLEFYTNSVSNTNTMLKTPIWDSSYKYIYYTNAFLEGLQGANLLSFSLKDQLEGEALFIRAFCYFYLVNLFGDVPLVLSTDYKVNSKVHRSTVAEIYKQIIVDLNFAYTLLKEAYPSAERVRPNKAVVAALLARVYLYTGDWKNAELYASELINNKTTYVLLDDPTQVFLKASKEAIWQLMPVRTTVNTNEGEIFILTTAPTYGSIANQLFNGFESGDRRKTSWIGSIKAGTETYYFPYKYKVRTGAVLTEYYMVMRLAEQYLIRAEARIQQGRIKEGLADLNVLRARARTVPTAQLTDPLPVLTYDLSQIDALLAVEKERRAELFCEWGHRWLDLKRTGRADAVLASIKGDYWQASDKYYPIHQSEINLNTNLK